MHIIRFGDVLFGVVLLLALLLGMCCLVGWTSYTVSGTVIEEPYLPELLEYEGQGTSSADQVSEKQPSE